MATIAAAIILLALSALFMPALAGLALLVAGLVAIRSARVYAGANRQRRPRRSAESPERRMTVGEYVALVWHVPSPHASDAWGP